MRYPAVLSEHLTLQMALDGKNLSRFGDGELKLATGRDAVTQRHHLELERALRRILREPRPNVVACIPNIAKRDSPKDPFWTPYRSTRYLALYDVGRIYGSAFVSRPDSSPQAMGPDYWARMCRLWLDKDVLVVTGSAKGFRQEDLGWARSVEMLAAPAQQAWDVHDDLLDLLKGECRTVLLCLGATATVLAWELAAHGVHAIDLGHAGMFLRKAQSGQPLLVTDDDRAKP